MKPAAARLWARTAIRVWPERYHVVSLPLGGVASAVEIVSRCAGTFASLLLERDEVSVVVPEIFRERFPSIARSAGPYRVVTLDIDVDLNASGYLAPAAERLAKAAIPIVPQCGFLKDHILVRDRDAKRAVAVLERLVKECVRAAAPRPRKGRK
jgi:hypothetical protein